MALGNNGSRMRALAGVLVLAVGVAPATAEVPAEPAPAPAPAALPTPKEFVTGLDLECYRTSGPALNINIQLSHLNPVLQQLGLPAHNVIIRELVETCVPVMKNNVVPPAAALPFIQHVDLACYRVEAAQLTAPVTINLRHLNPVLQTLPPHNVTMVIPQQLCLPVGKNGVAPPPEVLNLVRYIDLECWRVDPQAHPNFAVQLRQLNPQLGNILPHNMTLVPNPRQLCVPVRKAAQVIPPESLAIIRWLDLERFQASPAVSIAPVNVVLNHLNPFFVQLPTVPVTLQFAQALMVPVSKNGATPP